MKPYHKKNIPLAKSLRKNMTPWERKLWYDFLRYYPVRFQRQKAIGEYIVDFYCAKARLVIELDGGGHYEANQAAQDALRTASLEKMNLTVLRICNLDIDKNFSGVCEYIDMYIKNSLPQSATLTAPSSEGATGTGKAVYALGVFDGVHTGHSALLAACRQLAAQTGAEAGVVTFSTHPDTLVLGKTPPFINTLSDREALLRQASMARIVSLPFDRTLMQMPWQDFLTLLQTKYGAVGFVCGEDFRFGKGGEGSATLLQQTCNDAGLSCAVVPQQYIDGTPVSSSYIRQLLSKGEMGQAVRFLGHPHRLTGTVVAGKQLGRTIGIPTANLELPEYVAVPKYGVYACRATVDGKQYPAVTNIGTRPTVDGQGVSVESWLLDFSGNLYGKTLTLEFYSFLREEQKFPSLADLLAEIQKNALQTRKFFENN